MSSKNHHYFRNWRERKYQFLVVFSRNILENIHATSGNQALRGNFCIIRIWILWFSIIADIKLPSEKCTSRNNLFIDTIKNWRNKICHLQSDVWLWFRCRTVFIRNFLDAFWFNIDLKLFGFSRKQFVLCNMRLFR